MSKIGILGIGAVGETIGSKLIELRLAKLTYEPKNNKMRAK